LTFIDRKTRCILSWSAIHHAIQDKIQTYSVEGTNADLRHKLARLREDHEASQDILLLYSVQSSFLFLLITAANFINSSILFMLHL